MFLNESLKVFSGSSNPELAVKICKRLDVPMGNAVIRRFPDGEKFVKIDENVRGKDCFIIQSTSTPVDENLMEMLIMIDTLKRASASRITAVMPYCGYARQDRKDEGRVPITAKLVANLLTSAGASRVLAIDLHARQMEGFFDIPVDHLMAEPLLAKHLRNKRIDKPIVVSPDVGNVKTASRYVEHLGAELAIVHKRRLSGEEVSSDYIIGDVEGRNVIMVDDMISTAGTICSAAKLIKSRGAKSIVVGVTHGLFCGPAMERIANVEIDEFVVTDTVPPSAELRALKQVTILSMAEMLAEGIKRIHRNESISSLLLL
ncbi:MAG: ribose-phosphate diphosphokinase [Phycisphaerae bacterium]